MPRNSGNDEDGDNKPIEKYLSIIATGHVVVPVRTTMMGVTLAVLVGFAGCYVHLHARLTKLNITISQPGKLVKSQEPGKCKQAAGC